MMLHETTEDLQREKLFMDKIAKTYNCKILKLGINWSIDAMAVKEKQGELWIASFLEFKCRNALSTSYPTIIIGLTKALNGMKLARHSGVPFNFFVRFRDKDMWMKIKSVEGMRQEMWKAKNHADDPKDTKMIVHLPIEEFKDL